MDTTLLTLYGELREAYTIATSGVSLRGGEATRVDMIRKFDRLEQAIAERLMESKGG